MFTSRFITIRILLAINILAAVVLMPVVNLSWLWVLVAMFMYACMNGLGIGLGNHRYWSHKSFEFKYSWMKYLCGVCSVISGTGSTIGWVGIHRNHHVKVDSIKDPHSPKHLNLFNMLFLKYNISSNDLLRRCTDIAKDKFMKFTHQYWLPCILSYITVLSFISLEALYFMFIIPSMVTMFMQAFTNYFCHKDLGYKNYISKYADDKSKNIWWLAYLNFGEGWHNNHHCQPLKYTNKVKWWELDLLGSIISRIKQ
jgi:stearoyl-CoA desaturase (delta-9 desaturase)|tara:strand:+ start:382 stop:1146 length:765 start_codon:yes stop_codon:yes gene_type:complete